MTLSLRLGILILMLVLLAFVGTLLITVHNSHGYLQRQLSSHAQDTATSLSLSTYLQQEDRAMVVSMANAIFDRGDYLHLRVEDAGGTALLERRLPLPVEQVPDWFVRGLTLAAPTMQAQVMSGWRQAGPVQVQSDPGYAYAQLWENSRQALTWLGAAGLLVLGVGLWIMRRLIDALQPLGTGFSLDRFGRGSESITTLKTLKLDYIKIDGGFVRDLDSREEHQFFVQALTDIAHGLDIQVIVETVENQAVWELLPDLNVDGALGYFIARPE